MVEVRQKCKNKSYQMFNIYLKSNVAKTKYLMLLVFKYAFSWVFLSQMPLIWHICLKYNSWSYSCVLRSFSLASLEDPNCINYLKFSKDIRIHSSCQVFGTLSAMLRRYGILKHNFHYRVIFSTKELMVIY